MRSKLASMKGGADAPPNICYELYEHGLGVSFNEGRGRCPAKRDLFLNIGSLYIDASMKGGADAPPNVLFVEDCIYTGNSFNEGRGRCPAKLRQ